MKTNTHKTGRNDMTRNEAIKQAGMEAVEELDQVDWESAIKNAPY